jgi:hypothetical protein
MLRVQDIEHRELYTSIVLCHPSHFAHLRSVLKSPNCDVSRDEHPQNSFLENTCKVHKKV